eukprot:TRINITY_DN7850_c0_g2_i1.p1 TRINITY_DN7850_c0_g2~~TRINITY_DN7850_c0_g2_i1.p1  ORF type:complete len:528 (+),score=107.74 TRINITY_DN7850_c0_g2_i1:36-1586(+)
MLVLKTLCSQPLVTKSLQNQIRQECRAYSAAIHMANSRLSSSTESRQQQNTASNKTVVVGRKSALFQHGKSAKLEHDKYQLMLHTSCSSSLAPSSPSPISLSTPSPPHSSSPLCHQHTSSFSSTPRRQHNSTSNSIIRNYHNSFAAKNVLTLNRFSANNVGLSAGLHTTAFVGNKRDGETLGSDAVGGESVLGGEDLGGVGGDMVEAALQIATEPTFRELGLGSGWPSGIAQMFMEFIHVDLGLPWWQVIGCTTLLLRLLLFPVLIKAQRNLVRIHNHQPEVQKIQIETNLAAMRGEQEKVLMLNKALMKYMSQHDCHPIKTLLPMMFQGTFFMTMFFALRGMADLPVPSLTTGGLHWFTDLSVVDPFYLLPVITGGTLYLQIYLGADGMNTSSVPPFMKKVLYAMPLITLPVMMQFPAALNVYWLSNNLISLVQARTLKLPAVREKLGIEEMKTHDPKDLPMNNFMEEMKRESARQQKEAERKKLNEKKEEELYKQKQKEKREEILETMRKEDKQ